MNKPEPKSFAQQFIEIQYDTLLPAFQPEVLSSQGFLRPLYCLLQSGDFFEFGNSRELPFGRSYDYQANEKECCEWGDFVCSIVRLAHENDFPELLIDWCHADVLWRENCCTGFEAFRMLRQFEYEYRFQVDMAWSNREEVIKHNNDVRRKKRGW